MDLKFISRIQSYSIAERQKIYANLKSKLKNLQKLVSKKKEKLKLCQMAMIESDMEREKTRRMLSSLKSQMKDEKVENLTLSGLSRSRAYSDFSSGMISDLAQENKALKEALELESSRFSVLSSEILEVRQAIDKIEGFLLLIDKLEVLEIEFLDNEDINTTNYLYDYDLQN